MTAATPLLRQSESSNAFVLIFGVLAVAAVGAGGGLALGFGELDAFWVCLAVLASLAVLFDFRIGAVLLMVLLPIEASTLFPHSIFGLTGLNPVNLLLLATLVSYLVRARAPGSMRILPRQLLWLYIVPIALAGLLGSRHAQDFVPALYDVNGGFAHFREPLGYLRDLFLKPMFLVLAAMLVGAAVVKSKKADSFLAPMVISIWVMCLVAIGYVVSEDATLGELASPGARNFFQGIGFHANELGRLYAVAYALLLFTWGATPSKAVKAILVASMGIVTIALALTFSRGAFLGFAVVNVLFLLWRFNVKTLALALLVLVFAAMFMPGAIYDRVTMGFATGSVNTVSAGRVDEIWLPLLPELLRTPPWGSGLGSIMWSEPMWAGTMQVVGHPHNAYLEALLDLGAIGFCLVLAYYWHVWRRLRDLGSSAYLTPAMRGFFQGTAAGLISFFVSGFTGSSLMPKPEYVFLWLAIGMMYGQLARRPTS